MKIVSQLDLRGYFIGPVEADESPLEAGSYLLPGGAVDAPVPENIPDGHVAKWVDGWVFEPNPAQETPPPVDLGAAFAEKLSRLRSAREVTLNRLSGIALAAQLTGDTATTTAYIAVRQGLLDITANLPQDGTVDGVVMGRYATLVAQCTPQMVSAFAQVDQ